jgi:hypothetical protein
LFLLVRTHRQLQQHCKVAETRDAANESGVALGGAGNSPRIGKVVQIHPDRRATRNRI